MTDLLREAPFLIGNWHVNPADGTIRRDNLVMRLEPRVMQVLVCLANHAGEVVSKDRLQEQVWHGRIVSDEAIQRCISQLRRALDDSFRNPHYIETVPKRGYRLLQLSRPDSSLFATEKKQNSGSVPSPKPNIFYRFKVPALVMGALFCALLVFNQGGWKESGSSTPNHQTSSNVLDRAENLYERREFAANALAIDILERAESDRNLLPHGYVLLAKAYSLKYAKWTRHPQDIGKAIAAATTAVKLDDSNPKTHRTLGVARSMLGDYPGALQALESSLAIDPRQWATLSNIGLVYYKLRFYETAASYFEQALQISPQNGQLFKKLGAVSLKLNKLGDAEKWYNKLAIKDSATDYANAKIAYIQLLRGNYEAAKSECSQYLTDRLENKYCALMYGKTLIAAGEYDAAYKYFQNQPSKEPKLVSFFDAYELIAAIRSGQNQNVDQEVIELMARVNEDRFLSRNDRDEIKLALTQAVM